MTCRTARRAALAALLTANLLPAAAARAASTDNPQWEIESGLLGPTETVLTSALAETSQKITITKSPVLCKTLSFAEKRGTKTIEHDFKGSSAPSPGTGTEALNYGGCEVEGASSCTINSESAGHAKIETEPLNDTLVFSSKVAAEKEEARTLTLFEPRSKAFASITFGSGCPVTGEVKINGGAILAENQHWTSFGEKDEFTFPTKAIQAYFKNTGGHTEEVKINDFKSEGPTAGDVALAGTIAIIIVGAAIGAIIIFN